MKLEVVLKPCPWCQKTPDIWMPIEEDTWCWTIVCENKDCFMKPTSPHVSIRKTTKSDFLSFHGKIKHLANTWNRGNLLKAYEKKVIDLAQLKDLDKTAESLCSIKPWFKKIDAI